MATSAADSSGSFKTARAVLAADLPVVESRAGRKRPLSKAQSRWKINMPAYLFRVARAHAPSCGANIKAEWKCCSTECLRCVWRQGLKPLFASLCKSRLWLKDLLDLTDATLRISMLLRTDRIKNDMDEKQMQLQRRAFQWGSSAPAVDSEEEWEADAQAAMQKFEAKNAA